MAEITCLECGQRNVESVRFCTACGAMVMPSDGSRPAEPASASTFEIGAKPWLPETRDETGQSGTADATAITIETAPPPTEVFISRTGPDQWMCILCSTSNDKERTFCSYCGNRRGATADETGMLPKPTSIDSPLAPVAAAAGKLWREAGRRVRTSRRPSVPGLRVDPRVVVALVAAVAVVLVATHLPTGGPLPTPTQQVVIPPTLTPPTITPPTIAPPPTTRDTLTATVPDSPVNELGPGYDRIVSQIAPFEGNPFALMLTKAGDLELRDAGQKVRWRAGVKGGARVDMQRDGNFVVYGSAGNALWASDTVQIVKGKVDDEAYWIVVQPDGNLTLHKPGASGALLWNAQSDHGCVGSWCGACVTHCPATRVEPPTRKDPWTVGDLLVRSTAPRHG